MTWLDNFPDNVEKTAKIICNSECVNESKKVTKIKKNTKSKKPSQRKFNMRIQSTRISDYMNLNKKYQEDLTPKLMMRIKNGTVTGIRQKLQERYGCGLPTPVGLESIPTH